MTSAVPVTGTVYAVLVNHRDTRAVIGDVLLRPVVYSFRKRIVRSTVEMTAIATLSAGQEFVFVPKGTGVLVMPVPERAALAGIPYFAKA